MKSLDINVFLLENKRLREQLASAEEKYNLASTELVETGEKYEGIKEEYERIQQEIESLDTAIEAAREQLTDTGLMRGKLEGEINVLKEQINSAHGSENHLNNRKAALEEEIAGKEQEKQDILTDKRIRIPRCRRLQKLRQKQRLIWKLSRTRSPNSIIILRPGKYHHRRAEPAGYHQVQDGTFRYYDGADQYPQGRVEFQTASCQIR